MTRRVAILPYGPSDSCRLLKDALAAAIETARLDATVRLLRTTNSIFSGRTSDLIINYGNRSAPATTFGQAANILNPQAALNNAANKRTALQQMQDAGVSTIPWTADAAVAREWAREGATVYKRTTLNGHSGEGIEIINNDNLSNVGNAPLYTKGITGQRREWRVHVFKGTITYVQVKRRRNGYESDPAYREDVRNHHTGWIYATENLNPNDAVLRNAVAAVSALGLDFGAVDLISRNNDAWVLEVNTAPGLSGTTLETYTHNIIEWSKSILTGAAPEYRERFAVPAAPQATASAPATETAPTQEAAPAPSAPAAPTSNVLGGEEVQAMTGNERTRLPQSQSTQETGYYVADILSGTGRGNVVAENVILWFTNGRYFRQGWNLPLNQGDVRNPRRVTSVNVGNTVLTYGA